MKTSELFNAKESSKKLNILKEENRMKKLLTTTLIILILFVAVPFSHAEYEVSQQLKEVWQLTNDTYDDLKPQINNAGEVVYEKHLVGDSEIYIHIDAGEYNVSNSPGGFDYNPQINSRGDVLWESDVKGLHFITLQHSNFMPQAISPPDPDNPGQFLPLLYGGETYPQFNDNNQVAWRASTEINMGKDDIWLYSFDNYKKLKIQYGDTGYPVFGQMDKHPQINANGDVVWQGGVIDNGEYGDELEESYYFDIFLYDGNTPKNISKRIGVHDTHPQINDAGVVVWQSGGQIYRYSEGVSKKISYNSGYSNSAPQIINHCGVVVWQGCNDSDCEIFLYKDEYGAINISNDPGRHDDFPQINEKGQVVWVRDYSYDLPMKGLEVMLFDPFENTLTNISNRNGDDEDPQINDKGEVVWSGYHEGNWEIFKKALKIDMTAVDDEWQLSQVNTIFDLCESISDIFWSLQEAQVVEKVEFKNEMSQAPTKVKVPLSGQNQMQIPLK